MLFISSWNLLTTKQPSIFYLKKNTTKEEKKLTSPFAFEGRILFICTEIEWILQYLNLLISISLQVIMEAVKGLSALTAVKLTERLKVL